jgi:hypothetical protein
MPLSLDEFESRVKQAEQARAEAPWGLAQRVAASSHAAWEFVASGFARVTAAEYERRMTVCEGCPHWNGVRCDICRCFSMKLHLPSERCPIGKWDCVKSRAESESAAVSVME